MLNQSVWSEACWLHASPSHHSVPAPFPAVCSHAHLQSACVVFVWSIFSSPATGSCASVCLVSSSERMSWSWIPAESSEAAPSPAWCTIKDHGGCPETISSLSGIRLLFWLTGEDKCEELLCNAFLWKSFERYEKKKEAADEKFLILYKMQNRFSHVRH